MLLAWVIAPTTVSEVTVHETRAILVLEDGTPKEALLSEIRFDYRYDLANQAWVDTSRPIGTYEDGHADADQEAPDDGSS